MTDAPPPNRLAHWYELEVVELEPGGPRYLVTDGGTEHHECNYADPDRPTCDCAAFTRQPQTPCVGLQRVGVWRRAAGTRAANSRPAVDDLVAGFKKVEADTPPSVLAKKLHDTFAALHGADPVEVAAVRAAIVTRLWKGAKISGATELVDSVFHPGAQNGGGPLQGQAAAFPVVEPWHEPVDLAAVLGELVRMFQRFLALPEGGATLLAVWTLWTWVFDVWDVAPFVAITSPEKGCGKTKVIRLLHAVTPRPVLASSLSPAVVFRIVEAHRPTLLIDEADSFMKSDELRGVLNAGYDRDGVVWRTAGDDHEPRSFRVFCPKVIARIGDLPDTLADRSIHLRMQRATAEERDKLERLDRHELQLLKVLARKVCRAAGDHRQALMEARPAIPPELIDRDALSWEPLLSIADRAGGHWPDRARRAAVQLSGHIDSADRTLRELLLADLRDLFKHGGGTQLGATEIVQALVEHDDRPWAEMPGTGRPLTVNKLASLLRQLRLGIKSRQLWFGATQRRGYRLADLQVAFARYAPDEVIQDPSEVSRDTPPPTESSREKPHGGSTRDGVTVVTGTQESREAGSPDRGDAWEPEPGDDAA